LWSTGGTAIKLTSLGAPAIAGGRAVIAALALLIALPDARRLPTRRIAVPALAYAATCILFVVANTLTTAGHAIFIQNTAPVWVLLIAPRLLGERATRAELISIPFGLIGCGLVFADRLGDGKGGDGALAGDLCALAASFTYALLIVLYRKRTREEALAATVWGNALIMAMMAPLAARGALPDVRDLAVLAYLGLIQQALTTILFVRGIRHVSALEGALLTLIEPLMSPVWAYLLVGEKMGPLALGGAGLIAGTTLLRALTAVSPRKSSDSARSD
jgi:drug/metabolite transporter (DMT)-like permease